MTNISIFWHSNTSFLRARLQERKWVDQNCLCGSDTAGQQVTSDCWASLSQTSDEIFSGAWSNWYVPYDCNNLIWSYSGYLIEQICCLKALNTRLCLKRRINDYITMVLWLLTLDMLPHQSFKALLKLIRWLCIFEVMFENYNNRIFFHDGTPHLSVTLARMTYVNHSTVLFFSNIGKTSNFCG